jgi:hypothetical protein
MSTSILRLPEDLLDHHVSFVLISAVWNGVDVEDILPLRAFILNACLAVVEVTLRETPPFWVSFPYE